jgi:hypothetical protein
MNEPDALQPISFKSDRTLATGNAYFAFRALAVIISDPIFPYNQAILFQGDPS